MTRQRQIIVLLILMLSVLIASVYVFFARPKIQAAILRTASVAMNTNTPGALPTSVVSSPIASTTRIMSSIVSATQTPNIASVTSAPADKNTSLPISPTEKQSTPIPTEIGKSTAPFPLLMIVELQPESPMVGGQAVWIFNPSNTTVDLGCWALRSSISGNTVVVEPNLQLPAGTVVMLIPEESWLGVRDQIQLLDRSRHSIDQTPELIDDAFDDQLWFRNANGQWSFGRTQINANVIQGHVSIKVPSGC